MGWCAKLLGVAVLIIAVLCGIGYNYATNLKPYRSVPQEKVLQHQLFRTFLEGFYQVAHLLEPHGYANRLISFRPMFPKTVRHTENVTRTDTKIAGVPVIIQRPSNKSPGEVLPTVIFFHGGGFAIGSAELYHPFTHDIARDSEMQVISVEYRLAPEHPWPAGYDDCLAVAREVTVSPVHFSASVVILAGDSSGATLAAGVAVELTHKGASPLDGVVMISPGFQVVHFHLPSKVGTNDDSFGGPLFIAGYAGVMDQFDDEMRQAMVDMRHVKKGQRHLIKDFISASKLPEQLLYEGYEEPIFDLPYYDATPKALANLVLEPRAFPLLTPNDQLRFFPPTFIESGGRDNLLDDAYLMTGRLRSNIIEVEHYVNKEGDHCPSVGYSSAGDPAGEESYRALIRWLKERVTAVLHKPKTQQYSTYRENPPRDNSKKSGRVIGHTD